MHEIVKKICDQLLELMKSGVVTRESEQGAEDGLHCVDADYLQDYFSTSYPRPPRRE